MTKLAPAEKPIAVMSIAKQAIRNEDGLSALPDDTIDNLDIDAYDSLILPGAMDIRITSISYNFFKWALALEKMPGIDIPAKPKNERDMAGFRSVMSLSQEA